jgi:hypothetical protein
MIKSIRRSAILPLLFAISAVAPGYAVADPPVPSWEKGDVPFDAVLYETTENLSMKALARGRRKALSSSLLGFARRGSALCPEALVLAAEPKAQFCTLNSTGSDNISLLTGKGIFGGDVEVTVQEVVGEVDDPNDPTAGKKIPVITPDSPEVVIATGRFSGKMDFSPAIVGIDVGADRVKVPFGTVEGFLSLDGFSKRVPFSGIFRLPFLSSPLATLLCPDEPGPLYLTGTPPDGGAACVGAGEMAIGYPAVRFEITFR